MDNCVILDDDSSSIKVLSHYIEKTKTLKLMADFSDAIDGLNYLVENRGKIDLLFLDIEMPEMNGFEILKHSQYNGALIIISANNDNAIAAFETNACFYLPKPFSYPQFLKGIEKRKEKEFNIDPNAYSKDFIFVKDDRLYKKILFSDISYCEGKGDYISLKCKNKTYTIKSTISNFLDKLSGNLEFVQVHRSYVINLHYLTDFDSDTSVVDGKIIPIGAKYKEQLKSSVNFL
ncbi:LytTR family DNA-binding domain-containing protein [uncultured Cyclobacterium sp.]|uniref:LytR/AlgR family response regulator transcription factor n=1 Tax=uncultured Cyclobacterium sp. TaxID=453820 RepID=UPI0030EB3332|tara:strand:+ start:144585 stop:145283 length:699 start_codon:yes stop_codon:yes gene_type:complete